MMRAFFCTMLAVVAGVATALACQVPVFRFALERWEADDYRIIVFEKGPRSAATTALIERLQQSSRHGENGVGHANVAVELADIDNLTDAQQWSLLGWESLKTFPAMQVYYPESSGIETPLWQGDLTGESIEMLLASPARQELTRRLTAGDSAVWLLFETADIAADALAEEKLVDALQEAEATLEIPEGVIRPEQLASTINTRDVPVEMDDVLRSRIPLKIAFSVLRLNPDDPKEAIFSRMLTQSDQSERAAMQKAVPVFGRGRMMPGIPVSRFSASAIGSATSYLCGACSCQVKEQNPGLDLLINTDWSRHLQDGLIVTERALPPLTGAGDIVEEVPRTSEEDTVVVTIKGKNKEKPFASTGLLTALGAVILGVFAGSVFLLRR